MLLPLKIIAATVGWLYVIGTCGVLFAAASLIWMVTAPFDRRRVILHRFTCWWGFHYMQVIPGWRVRFAGRERLEEGRTYVIVANHQSMIDILVLFGLRRQFKWVAKRSLFAVPFLGWNMWLNGYVGIRRGKARSVKRMLADCVRHLGSGSSLIFFPEGTRSEDGHLRPFKQGAFKLAAEHGVAVAPIVIEGARDVLAKAAWMLPVWKHVPVTVDILEPIDPADFDNDPIRLRDAARDRIQAGLERVQGGA